MTRTSSSSPNPANPDSKLALQMKFRNLTLLLRLLTTINKGCAILPDDNAPPIQDLPIRRKIVDAVTTILVRYREVIAATAYASCGSVIFADSVKTGGPVSTMPLRDAEHAEVDLDHEFDDYFPTAATRNGLSIAAVANPELNSAKHITSNLKLASGKDLWSRFDVKHCWRAMRK